MDSKAQNNFCCRSPWSISSNICCLLVWLIVTPFPSLPSCLVFLKQPGQRVLSPRLCKEQSPLHSSVKGFALYSLLASDLVFCPLQLYLYRGQDEEWDALGPAMVNSILLGQQSQHADHPSERGQDNGWETFLMIDSDDRRADAVPR
jgi:hypothetical protein